jgi:hypothetical protein
VFSGARGVAHGNTIVVITTNVKTEIANDLSRLNTPEIVRAGVSGNRPQNR